MLVLKDVYCDVHVEYVVVCILYYVGAASGSVAAAVLHCTYRGAHPHGIR